MTPNIMLMASSVNTLLIITYLLIFSSIGLNAYESTFLALLTVLTSNILGRFNLPLSNVELFNELKKASVIKLHDDFLVQSLRFRAIRTVAVEFNLGGALIPLTVSTLLFTIIVVSYGMTSVITTLILIAISTLIINRVSIVIRGLGLAVPLLITSLIISSLCLVMNAITGGYRLLSIHYSYLVAYMSVLLGVDLMNLNKITFYNIRRLIIGGLNAYDALSLIPAASTIITYIAIALLHLYA